MSRVDAWLIVFRVELDGIEEDRLECRCIIEYLLLLAIVYLNRYFKINFNKWR